MEREPGTAQMAGIVERACRGERSAQQELWRAHRRWVAAIVLAHRPRSIEVEDLMQEVALKLVDRIETLRDVASFRPWLRRIIINVCRGAARSLKPTTSLAASVAGGPSEDDRLVGGRGSNHGSHVEPGEQCLRGEFARRLLDQAMTLPPEYREPLLLRCLHDMTYQQIAGLLEVPITTVETRLARARRMLREELDSSETHRKGGERP